MQHPYRQAPDRAFWKKAVSEHWNACDTVERPLLQEGDRIVSAGSCFAANIVPYLRQTGLHYIQTETPHPAFGSVYRQNFSYDKFSAAYGNIYTTRHLLQLLKRATGEFRPREDRWEDEGRIIDPFRPGMAYQAVSHREFDLLTAQHLTRVMEAFQQASVFIFTMGMTEAWETTSDGAVFPACPGTIAGEFDAERYRFHNLTMEEVRDDLDEVMATLRAINPALRVVLTVSPVPLVATATGQHVLLATTYSKSVLRVAAAESVMRHKNVSYFPAYEIVTGPQAPAEFFLDDKREVSKEAIEQVMNAFLANFGSIAPLETPIVPPAQPHLSSLISDLECEEAGAGR